MNLLLNIHTRIQRSEPAAPCNAEPRFMLGRCIVTINAVTVLAQHRAQLSTLFSRHVSGDFGVVGMDSVRDNDLAISFGGRVISQYHLLSDDMLKSWTQQERRRCPSVWIVTEGGVTTALTERDL